MLIQKKLFIFLIVFLAILVTTAIRPSASAGAGPAQPKLPETLALSGPASTLYLIQLAEPPLASYRGGIGRLAPTSPAATGAARLDVTTTTSRAYLHYLDQQQAATLAEIEKSLGRPVAAVYRYQTAYNGFALNLTAEEAVLIAKLPTILNIQPSQEEELLSDAGPAWIGAPAIWNGTATGGLPATMGEGVIIGVIDTGINTDHPSFADIGGDGYNHTNPFGSGNYVGWCNPSHPNYNPALPCNDKLIGLYSYAGSGNNPEDPDGHGSHTASTAAGNIISASLIGPTTSISGTLSGVAPHANIIAYDVCIGSCPTAVMVAAINQAVADGVDVITLSISGGIEPYSDPVSLAFLAAVDAGIFVSAAAGNSGPSASTNDHNAPWVQTVAATHHDRRFTNSLVSLSNSTGPLPNIAGTGFTTGTAVLPLVYAADPPYSNALCSTPAAPATFTGKMVLCDNGGGVGGAAKANNILAGGAAGFVLANDVILGNFINASSFSLPGTNITYNDGVTLKAWLTAGTGDMAALTGRTVDHNPAYGDIIARFSSRGPSAILPGVIKPDIGAPGYNVWAASRNGVEFILMNGTSMATPHAAGAAALLTALHPTWTPAMIKSALMMTAAESLVKEDWLTPADPFDRGAGRVNLLQAGSAGLVLDEITANFQAADPDLGGDVRTLNLASLADHQCPLQCTWQRTFTSVLTTTATWTVTAVAPPGLNLTTTPASFTIGPAATQSITITATAPGLPLYQWYFASLHLSDGPGGAADAHLPVAIFLVPSTNPPWLVKTATANVPAGSNISYTINLTNYNFITTTFFLTDPIPANTTYLPGSAAGGLVYNGLTDQLNASASLAPAEIQLIASPSPFGYLPPGSLTSLTNFCLIYLNCDEAVITVGNMDFYYLGQHHTSLRLHSNGFLFVGTISADSNPINHLLPNPADPNGLITPFWTDLDMDGTSPTDPGGGYFYRAGYSSGSHNYTIIGWENAQLLGDPGRTYTFQVWIENGTENIWFVYQNFTGGLPGGAGSGLTIGAEDEAGLNGATYFYRPYGGGSDLGTAPAVATDLRVTTLNDSATFTFAATAAAVPTNTITLNQVSVTGNPSPMVASAATTILAQPVSLNGFTANGYTTVTLTYSGPVPFTTSVYLSYNGLNQDVLLDTVTVTDPDGSQDFTLATEIDLISGTSEINLDYYLLAAEVGGSTALFQGVYHYPNDMLFVHGRDTLTDTITLTRSGTNLVATWNIANSYTYPLATVTAVRARSHGDKDDVNSSGLTAPAAIPTYQMGGAGDDRLRGGSGSDVLVGGPGQDNLTGSGSTDKASYLDSPAGVTADIALGTAPSDGWGSTDTLLGLQNLEGSAFADTLSGNSTNNFIHGLGGNDTINGRDGFDTLYGGLDSDTINGGNQDDSITGGDGDDTLDGGSGNDTIAGENGNDTIYGAAGADSLLGHGGNDIIYGGANNDSLYGGSEIGVANDDMLYGEAGNDIIYGGSYNDIIQGGAGADTLYGGDGNDTVYANTATCTNDGAVDNLNGGTHLTADSGFYTFAQDTAAALESTTNCP